MKATGLVLVALLVGLLGFLPLGSVLFSSPVSLGDWHSGEFAALGLTLAIYLISGFAIGWLKPRSWMLALFTAWICVGLSLYNLALAIADPVVRRGVSVSLLVLVLPLAVTAGAAYPGGMLARPRQAR